MTMLRVDQAQLGSARDIRFFLCILWEFEDKMLQGLLSESENALLLLRLALALGPGVWWQLTENRKNSVRSLLVISIKSRWGSCLYIVVCKTWRTFKSPGAKKIDTIWSLDHKVVARQFHVWCFCAWKMQACSNVWSTWLRHS